MKIVDLETPYTVRHIAGPSVLTVVAQGASKIPYGGYPAVATRGDGDWLSGEVIDLNGEMVLAAVNGYGDESTARYDAGRRGF